MAQEISDVPSTVLIVLNRQARVSIAKNATALGTTSTIMVCICDIVAQFDRIFVLELRACQPVILLTYQPLLTGTVKTRVVAILPDSKKANYTFYHMSLPRISQNRMILGTLPCHPFRVCDS